MTTMESARPVILLVDDESEMLGLLGAEFQDAGFETMTASNIQDALQQLEKTKIDIVLSDVRMPGGSGLDFFKQVKRMNGQKPHFVFMSAFSDLEMAQAYDLGADALLVKPFQTQKAVEQIQYILGPRIQSWSVPYAGKPPSIQIQKNLKAKDLFEKSSEFKVGRGGFFIALKPEEMPAGRDLISFKVSFQNPDCPAFQGIGKVRWVRSRSQGDYLAGCGVEIVHLIESSREQISAYLQKVKPDSIIPAA